LPESLRQKGARGVLLVALLKVLGTIIGRVSQLVMPLFLLPSDFGLFALAVFFSGFLALAAEFGMSTDLVRRKKEFEEAADTAFTLRLALSITLVVVSVAVGWTMSIVYGEPRLSLPIMVLSLGLLFQSISMVPRMIATRALDFRRAAVPDSLGKFSTAFISIGLAIVGFAYWSPVYGTIAGAAIGAALQLAGSSWRPKLRFNPRLASEIARFGKFVTLSAIANFVAHSIDNAIVGLLLGFAPLGFYVVAYSWGVYFTSNLSSVFSSVAYPVMSEVSEQPERFRKVLTENIRFYAYVAFLLSVGVLVFAPTFVASLYGSEWQPAILPMQILAPVGLVLGFAGIAADALFAGGRSKTVSVFSWMETGIAVAAVPVATWYGGLAGASLAVLLGAAGLLIALVVVLGRETGIRGVDWLRATRHPLAGALVAGTAGIVMTRLLPPSLPAFFLGVGTFTALYVATLQGLSHGQFIRELRTLVRLAMS